MAAVARIFSLLHFHSKSNPIITRIPAPISLPLSLKLFGQPSTRSVHTLAMERNSGSNVSSIVVYVTVPNREAGIESIYFWDGKVQNDSEELLIIKTRESLLEALTEHVKANHEYEVPEVISLPITGGNDKYLEWIKNSTRNE